MAEDSTKHKPVTIPELKMFIEAVEFASDTDEWTPSVRQWTKIRSMIDSLQESPVKAQGTQPAPSTNADQQLHQLQNVGQQAQMLSPGDSQLHQLSQLHNAQPHPQSHQNSSEKWRTPNIDTSNGNYDPPFV